MGAPAPYQGFIVFVELPVVEGASMMRSKKFVDMYGEELCDKVKICVPSSNVGCTWKLGLTKRSNGSVWLDEGFEQFVRHYSIDEGYLLTFSYNGMSTLKVRIYNDVGFEIPYCRNDADAVVLKQKKGRRRPCRNANAPSVAREEARLLKMKLEETGMATDADFYREFASSSSPGKKPSCTVVVKPANVTKGRMYFPRVFWMMHMVDDRMASTSTSTSTKQRSIRIIESGGRVWEAVAYFMKDGGVIVNCKEFVVENGLRAGELVSSAKAVFKASILSAT